MNDTPITDSAAKAVGSLACQWKTGSIDAVQFESAAQAEFDKLGQLERENALMQDKLNEAKQAYGKLRAFSTWDEQTPFDAHAQAEAAMDALLANNRNEPRHE